MSDAFNEIHDSIPLERNDDADVVIELCGQTIALMPERAAWWKNTDTLLVADPHFGKSATFRAGGIPVPSGTTHEALSRLRNITARTRARRIVFLGDMLHAKAGRSDDMLASLVMWREDSRDLDLTLVRGNHDRHAGDPPGELGMTCVDAPFAIGPFAMSHHPAVVEGAYVLAGHVHPGIRLYGAGGQRERLPCFLIGARCAIMPAFGDFTGLSDVDPREGDEVYAVAGREVVRSSLARNQAMR